MNTTNQPILKNVVSPRWSKTLADMGVPHTCANYWLWNPSTNEARLTGYFFDVDKLGEQADANLFTFFPQVKKFPAYTINELDHLLGDYTLMCRQGHYKIHNLYASAECGRLADTYALLVMAMLDKGVLCSRTFKCIQSG